MWQTVDVTASLKLCSDKCNAEVKSTQKIVKFVVPHYTVLYCTVLYRTVYCVLYCTELYRTIPHCTVMYCTVPYHTSLYHTVLCSNISKNTISGQFYLFKCNVQQTIGFFLALIKLNTILLSQSKIYCIPPHSQFFHEGDVFIEPPSD